MADSSTWRDVATPPPLLPDEVHVWRAVLGPGAASAAALDDAERARAARFYYERHRRRFVAARAILRRLLGRYLGVAPGDVAFAYGEHGKPALPTTTAGAAPHPLRFNLSHCADRALLAFAVGRDVGVDLERPRPRLDTAAAAERWFSPRESDELRALPLPRHADAFAAGWARKEAYLKGRASGLARSLTTFSVSLAAADGPVSLVDPDGDGWVVCALAPGDGYAGALAVERGAGVTVRRLRWELEWPDDPAP